MTVLVVLDEGTTCPIPGARAVSAAAFLAGEPDLAEATLVVNLCGAYRYKSPGYYVSLLAEARGQRVSPTVASMQDVQHRTLEGLLSDQLAPLFQRALGGHDGDHLSLDVYFGQSPTRAQARLAAELFRSFPLPLFRAELRRRGDRWRLLRVAALSITELPSRRLARFAEAAASFVTAGALPAHPRQVRARLAILCELGPATQDPPPPSNPAALDRFVRAAERVGLDAELVPWSERARVASFHGLFLRVPTVGNDQSLPSYAFARRMEAAGLVVVDDPASILKCSSKAYLAERLRRGGVPIPKTLLLDRATLGRAADELGLPCVLKAPDGFDSVAVVKVTTRDELRDAGERLLGGSHLIAAQEFLPTDYDWRIGVFDHQPLWACRYYMARGHWQVVKRSPGGHVRRGREEDVRVEDAPRDVVETALRATALIGDGLYGVDLKAKDGRCTVVEVNDNPTIDHGAEDRAEKDALYERIMRVFLRRIARVAPR